MRAIVQTVGTDESPDVLDTLATKVRAERERRGWSQLKLAREAELAPLTVFEIERGLRNVKLHTVQALARALGVRIGRLLA